MISPQAKIISVDSLSMQISAALFVDHMETQQSWQQTDKSAEVFEASPWPSYDAAVLVTNHATNMAKTEDCGMAAVAGKN